MAAYKINHSKKVLELSQSFEKKSGVVTNEEFNTLSILRNAYPDYLISVVKSKAKNEGDKTSLKIIEDNLVNTNYYSQYKKMRENKVNFLRIRNWYNSIKENIKPLKS